MQQLIDTMLNQPAHIDLQLEMDNHFFGLNTAIPLGLILNELVTNSLKHAFGEPGQAHKGRIFLKIDKQGHNKYILSYGDDGPGFAADIQITKPASLGLKLIHSLVRQLQGQVEISNTTGSVTVSGWTKNEVEVTGDLGDGSERLDLTSSGGITRIKVVLPKKSHDVGGSDLEIRVPSGSSLSVNTVNADINVTGIRGAQRLQTVNADITTEAGATAGLLNDLNEVRSDTITPSWFRAVGAPLLRGRLFDEGDRSGTIPVAIVNETMARRLWPGEDPVGKRFKFGPPASRQPWERSCCCRIERV